MSVMKATASFHPVCCTWTDIVPTRGLPQVEARI
jgi:hypothetical protein